jgi:zinc/manganese transport system substrate-binding protein
MQAHIDRATHRGRQGARWLAAALAVPAVLLAACGSAGSAASTSSEGDGLSIVATTTILGDVASQLVGDAGNVSVLMPAGTDPHIFEPSAQQLAQMQQADLIVANGANLEEHLQDPLTDAENAGVPVFHATDHVQTLAFEGHEAEEEHAEEDEHASDEAEHADEGEEHSEEAGHADETGDEHGHEEGSIDPHFWMDPTRTADVVLALGEQIGELTGESDAVQAEADRYAGQLADLDGEIADTLAAIPDGERTLVTNHEAFNYFAEHYGFTIVGTVIPSLSTGAEPSAHDLEELIHTVQEQHVRAIFAENIQPERLAETLAQEAGSDVQVVELYSDSLGDEGSEAATYPDMLRANARLISEALGS